MSRPPIANRYHVVDGPLPGGAMAQVYKAYDLRNEHGEVAVKLLPLGASAQAHQLSYQRECQALGRLEHPHIVELLDSGDDPRRPAVPSVPVVQPPAAGAPARAASDVLGGLVGAIRLADPAGAGRGSSPGGRAPRPQPANIMLDADGHPRVIDFGIAKIYGLIAPEGTIDAASAPFTPPEPVSQSPPMTRDVHAWAALTVFALSGAGSIRPRRH